MSPISAKVRETESSSRFRPRFGRPSRRRDFGDVGEAESSPPISAKVRETESSSRRLRETGRVRGQVALCALLALFPGEPFDYDYADGNTEALKAYRENCVAARAKGERPPPKPAQAAVAPAAAAAPPVAADPPLVIDEAKLAAKAKEAERLFGIPAARYTEAVEQATAEANAGVECDETTDAGLPTALTTTLPLMVAVALAIGYARNGAATMSFPAYLARSFPREARVFGIEL